MKILAIDTSAKTASAAVCDGTRLLSIYTQNVGLTQSETMLPMVDSILRDSKISVDDIDALACTTGPGSFTGVRIGVSVVKGLAFGKEKICIGVSSLKALSYNVDNTDALIVPVMDARADRLYCAAFEINGGKRKRVLDDDVMTVGELEQKLAAIGRDVIFVGDGRNIAKKMTRVSFVEAPYLLSDANGYSVAMAALDEYENADDNAKKAFTDMYLCPVYLRPSQAERTLVEKEKQNGKN